MKVQDVKYMANCYEDMSIRPFVRDSLITISRRKKFSEAEFLKNLGIQSE